MTIARVELDVPVAGPFDYETGGVDVDVGALVAVPFGRRRLVGVVTELAQTTGIHQTRLKRVERVLPVDPLPASTLSASARASAERRSSDNAAETRFRKARSGMAVLALRRRAGSDRSQYQSQSHWAEKTVAGTGRR